MRGLNVPKLVIGCTLMAGCGNPEPEYLKFEARALSEAGKLEAAGRLDDAAAKLKTLLSRFQQLPEKLKEKHKAGALALRGRIQELQERSAARRAREEHLRQVREKAAGLKTYEEIVAFLATLPPAEEADLKELVAELRVKLEALRPRTWGDFVGRFDEAMRQDRFRDAAAALTEAQGAIRDPDELRRVQAARASLEPIAKEGLRRLEGRCKRTKLSRGLEAARAEFDRDRFAGVLDSKLLDESWERVARFE